MNYEIMIKKNVKMKKNTKIVIKCEETKKNKFYFSSNVKFINGKNALPV